MKRTKLSILLIIFMSMMSGKAFGHDIEVANADGITIYYNWINNKTELAVTHKGNIWDSYHNYSGNIVIPEYIQYNGQIYRVTSIGEHAFMGCRNLTSITIPNSVTSIGVWAFKDCGRLTSISIPSSVNSIGQAAFHNSGWYNGQNDGPLYLDNWLLGYKGNMTTGTLSIRMETKGIADYAFNYCSCLTSIIIPNSVTNIGNKAFANCSNLTSIDIPNSVINIGNGVFEKCSSLTSVTIGNNVKSIGGYAFNNCSSLNSITIPNSVMKTGIHAFTGTGWYNSQNYGLLYLDNWLLEYKIKIGGASLKGDLSIKEGTKGIADYAFYHCSSLTSITIPNSVTAIGEYAFYYCFGLSSIKIPASVMRIGDFAFHDCGLTSIEVDAGNTTYDSRDNCNAIIESETNKLIFGCQNSTIPNTITSISDFAFSECGLASITIPNSVKNIGDRVFRGCQNLNEIVVESGNSIYDSRDNCNAIIETETNRLIFGCKNTLIPNSVTSIGEYAFESHNLPSITIPNSVTTIGDYAFMQCYGLDTIIIPNSVTRIGNYVFWDCSLTSVIIPNSVTRIGRGAFRDCNVITSITIPSSVTRIDEEAFSGCVSLTLVTSLNATPPSIYSSTFNNYSATLQVPTGSKTDYQNAKYWKNFTNIVEIDPTGVQTITMDKSINGPIYDLNGRKLKEPSKGINIIGGKKVVVK